MTRSGVRRAVVCAALSAVMWVFAAPVPAGAAGYFVTPTWGRLSSPLGWRVDPVQRTTWQHHWGIDIAAAHGTPVLASAAGTVQYVGAYAGYGNTVYIYHGNGWATVYAHLSAMRVTPGQRVARGARIGAVGNNGRSTGPHLHFEIRYRNRPVDPLKYLR